MTFSHHHATDQPEHPFAEFIRILGKGKRGARALSQDEAYRAMRMIMHNDVLPEQLGAFLMLMRIKEETPEELAGFVLAAREACTLTIGNINANLDWSSYAGKRRHLPWFLLSALLLTEQGVTVFMHGTPGPSASRLYTEQALQTLGLTAASSVAEANRQLTEQLFCYLGLQTFCPKLQEIIDLRPIMGLRSPMHTVVRMVNPVNADYSIQGIFHPSYRSVHQHASVLIRQPHMAVLKGEGGETERNPDSDCLVQSVHNNEFTEETWPALFAQRHVRPDSLQAENLALIWQGKLQDEYAEAAITGTAAIALKLLGKASSQQQAEEMAREFWLIRDKTRFG